ncbi:MAG: type II toxin-antitoxin system HicA family toxin [Patescibacteria group bacterium]
MKPLNAKALTRVLAENGFVLARQKGSHMIWKHRESGITVPVPLHGKSRPIPIGTLLAILKQSKIPPYKFK